MGPLSNAITLWLGIQPADMFLYVFLPPLLLDSAVSIDHMLDFVLASTLFQPVMLVCHHAVKAKASGAWDR